MSTINYLEKLNAILSILIKYKGTDLHIKSNSPARIRVENEVMVLNDDIIDASAIESLSNYFTSINNSTDTIYTQKEIDSIYIMNEKHHFRVNIYTHYYGIALDFKFIKQDIKTIEALMLPPSLHKISKLKEGLVLLGGANRSGKSSLLASFIEEINKLSHKHIITIEEPIEYLFKDKGCIIEQREIGRDTCSYKEAIYSAMRADPDIIVVGEIRTKETAEAILHAVNRGHLVFSTLHATDVVDTIGKLFSFFTLEDRNCVRFTLAHSLEAIITQRLIEGLSSEEVPAVEILFKSPIIEKLIYNNRDNKILEAMEEDNQFGSVTFEQSLYKLTLNKEISETSAYNYASSPDILKSMFNLNEYIIKQDVL